MGANLRKKIERKNIDRRSIGAETVSLGRILAFPANKGSWGVVSPPVVSGERPPLPTVFFVLRNSEMHSRRLLIMAGFKQF